MIVATNFHWSSSIQVGKKTSPNTSNFHHDTIYGIETDLQSWNWGSRLKNVNAANEWGGVCLCRLHSNVSQSMPEISMSEKQGPCGIKYLSDKATLWFHAESMKRPWPILIGSEIMSWDIMNITMSGWYFDWMVGIQPTGMSLWIILRHFIHRTKVNTTEKVKYIYLKWCVTFKSKSQ